MRVYFSHQALRSTSANGQAAGADVANPPRVVVIGNFDGVHLGHQELFRRARACADTVEVLALTFWPHPARALAPQLAPPLIMGRERRRERLAECGVDILVEQPFEAAFAGLSPLEFVEEVLCKSLRARYVVVGHDFTFGKARSGTTELLSQLLAARGAQAVIVPAVTVIDPQTAEPIVCSSTFVRKAAQAGQPERAALVLGRDLELEGEVVHGAARGRTLGFPTANLRCAADLAPGVGIYAAWAELLADEDASNSVTSSVPDSVTSFDTSTGIHPAAPAAMRFISRQVKERHPAAVSVGYNSTFTAGDNALPPLSIEAHLIERPGAFALSPFYGRTLRLHLRARLRGEERFSSVDALVAQIRRDIDATRSILEVAW